MHLLHKLMACAAAAEAVAHATLVPVKLGDNGDIPVFVGGDADARSARSRWAIPVAETRRIHPEPGARGGRVRGSRLGIALFQCRGGRWTRLFLQHYR